MKVKINNYLKEKKNTIIKNKKLVSNFGYLSVLQVLTLLIPLITYPYLIRVLGVNVYGIIAFSQAVIGYFVIFIDFGFNISEIKDISNERHNKIKLSEIVSSVITIKLIFTIISIIIIFIIAYFSKSFSQYKILYIASFGILIDCAINPRFYFQGIEQMKFISIFSICAKLIFVVLIFFIVKSPSQYVLVPLFTSIGLLFGSFAGLFVVFVKHKIKFRFYSPHILMKYIMESLPFFTSRISVVINSKTNVLLIGTFLGYTEVAYYDIAEKITMVLKVPFNILNQVIFPNVSKSKNITLVINVLKNLFWLYLVIYLSIYLWGEWIVVLLGSVKLIPALNIIYILSFTAITDLIVVFLGAPMLLVTGHKKEYNNSIIYGSIFYFVIILFLYLFKFIGLYQLATASVLTSAFILVYRFYYCKKYKLF